MPMPVKPGRPCSICISANRKRTDEAADEAPPPEPVWLAKRLLVAIAECPWVQPSVRVAARRYFSDLERAAAIEAGTLTPWGCSTGGNVGWGHSQPSPEPS
jgi:hypothetical protein